MGILSKLIARMEMLKEDFTVVDKKTNLTRFQYNVVLEKVKLARGEVKRDKQAEKDRARALFEQLMKEEE